MTLDKDLANLTTLSVYSAQKILSKLQDCVCYNLQEALIEHTDFIELDIYIGTLMLKLEEDKVFYKFIPSTSFEKDILYTISKGECPLISKLESSITEKITDAYKELF